MDNPNGGNQKIVVWGLLVIILILTVALAYILAVKKAEAPSILPEPVLQKQKPMEDALSEMQKTNTPEAPLAEQKVEDKYAGWSTYTSSRYKYEIRYPSGMAISEAKKDDFGLPGDSKMTFDEAYAKYTGQVCVSFTNKKGSVLISAPENSGYNYVICGRTGMGSDTKIKKSTEKIVIDSKEYSVNVNDMADSAGRTIETVVKLSDETQISFSASSETDREEIKKIVESYKSIK